MECRVIRNNIHGFELRILILSVICSIILGAILGIGIVLFVTKDQSSSNDESNMITLLSIIVTLGIAYSFYSVYRVSNEFEQIKEKTDHLNIQIEDGIKELNESIKQNDIKNNEMAEKLKLKSDSVDKRLELYRRCMAAYTNFNDRKYLLALKIEIETLAYALINYKYLSNELIENKNELESVIGSKRSLISNDLLKCIEHLTNEKVVKFPDNEYEDSKNAIFGAVDIIKKEEYFKRINYAESERYIYIFNLIYRLFSTIDKIELPFKIEEEDRLRLIFYSKGIIVGSKTDDQLCMSDWIQRYREKENLD